MNWIESYFDSDYLSLYEPNHTKERGNFEIDFLIQNAFDIETKNILDMPCGYGRHSLLLTERGYTVHGIDNSTVMLERAKKDRENLPVEVRKGLTYGCADMRSYQAPRKFDAALCMFSSLGYFEDSDSNESVIENLCVSTRSGGVIVIDLRNPIRDIIDFSKTEWRQEDMTNDVRVIQHLDPITFRHSLTYRYNAGGVEKEKTGTWQHYFLPELQHMLSRHATSVEKTFGNFKGDAYGPETRRLIIVARKK